MKTITVPLQDYIKNGNTLTDWLGYLWNRLYENPQFTRNLEYGEGLLAAQLYLNYLECINLRDRNNVPVFHRERWKPIIIRKSQAGTGNAALLRIGMTPTPVIGPQTDNDFVPGEIFEIGGTTDFSGSVSYPVSGITDIVTCITDNIVKPSIVLTRDTDFVIRDQTIFFLRANDPFGLGFPVRQFINEDGNQDEEIILWAADALIDAQYIYNYIGYVMNLQSVSDEFYRNMLNGLWTLYNDGTPIELFASAVGAMIGEPTVISNGEVVDREVEENGVRMIVTDKHVYKVASNATLRKSIVPGAILHAGEFLTETIRIYETLDPMKLGAVSEFGERMKVDVASLFFDKSLLRTELKFGIGANWELSDIVRTGVDSNGNPKLMFRLFGDADDITAFWEDFWTYCENHNISSETCFSPYVDDIVSPVDGAVYGRVMPMEYLMRYFLKANTFVIVVDRASITELPTDRDPIGLLTLLRDVIPAHVMMFVIEHRDVGGEEYDLNELESDMVKSYARVISDWAAYGLPSPRNMTYMDRPPIMKWIPVCQ